MHCPLYLRKGACRHGGILPELAGQGVQVQVVQAGPVVGLGELLGQLVQLGEVLQHAGAVAQAEPFLTLEAFGAGPVLAGAQGAQVVVELAELGHELRRAERLGGQAHQLLPLLPGHGLQHPLGCCGALGEGVDQLLDRLRILGKELAVLGHKVLEVRVGVLAAPVFVEQPVEVLQHLVDGRPVLIGGVLECLLHAGEPLVQDLAAQQVLDPLVGFPRGARLPVIGGQFVDRCRRGPGQVLQLHLPEGAVGVVHHGVAGQLFALLQHRGVQQLLDFVEGAVQLVPAQKVFAPLLDAAGEVVEAFPAAAAAPQELLEGVPGRVAGHDVLGDGVEGLRQVHRRGERIRSAPVPAVPGPVVNAHGALLSCSRRSGQVLSRKSSPRRRTPWRSAGRGRGLPRPVRRRRRAVRRSSRPGAH